jgi:hypothetical protein
MFIWMKIILLRRNWTGYSNNVFPKCKAGENAFYVILPKFSYYLEFPGKCKIFSWNYG